MGVRRTLFGHRGTMAESNRNRRLALFFVVLGIIVVLGGMLLIGIIKGDETDIDPQNGEITNVFLH